MILKMYFGNFDKINKLIIFEFAKVNRVLKKEKRYKK